MKSTWIAAIVASLFALGAVPVQAAADIDQYLMFSGFGTLGAVHSDYSQADFTATVDQPSGAGYSRSWSPTVDSKLGAQTNLTLNDSLSGVVQILSRDDSDGSYKPEVEWANLKYAITSDLAVRVGRMELPTYARSDVQNVGYTLPWVRVPIEITYTSTATHSDGVDVLYRIATGPVTQNLQALWGSATENLPGAAFTSEPARMVLFSDTLQYRDTSLHLAYQNCDPSGFPAGRMQLVGAGITYDPGPWFVTGDSNRTHSTFFGDSFAWYISGGVRLGRFTPYTFYSATHAASVGTSGLESLGNEHTVAVGVRWDFARSLDFKLQLEQVTLETLEDPAAFTNLQPGARVGDKANAFSLALDFVF